MTEETAGDQSVFGPLAEVLRRPPRLTSRASPVARPDRRSNLAPFDCDSRMRAT